MEIIRYARVLCGSLLLAAATLIAFGPAAFARPAPPAGGPGGVAPSAPPAQVHDPAPIVVHHGSPVWTFIVVAVAAIAATLVALGVLAKARPALRRRPVHA